MEEKPEIRFEGVLDHIALESQDLQADTREYERLGFHLEILYDDWVMMRDARGFGLALLGPGSKHQPHLGLRLETRQALEAAALREERTIKTHRDNSVSFYTRGAGRAVEVIYYPPEYTGSRVKSAKAGLS